MRRVDGSEPFHAAATSVTGVVLRGAVVVVALGGLAALASRGWGLLPFATQPPQLAAAYGALVVLLVLAGLGRARSRRGWIIALIAGVALSAPLLWLRNRLSDDAAFARARASGEPSLLLAYVSSGGRHAGEAQRELLPRAALAVAKREGGSAAIERFRGSYPGSVVDDDARAALAASLHAEMLAADTVAALRELIAKHPDADDVPAARAKIHALYATTLAEVRAHANPSRPDVAPVVLALLTTMDANESLSLAIRFRRRTSASLAAADKLLATGLLDEDTPAKGGGAAVAGHFEEAQAARQEETFVRAFDGALRQVFPADLFVLARGAPWTTAEPPEVDRPTLFVAYEVAWSGATYVGHDSGRRFVGIAVRFDVNVRVPGEKRVLAFSVHVEPPERFTADRVTPAGDAAVYDAMALRAEGDLASKLRAVVFGAASR